MATRTVKQTAGRARGSRTQPKPAAAAPAKKTPAKKTAAAGLRTCAAPECSVKFAPQRSTARYHSKACRERARRSRATQPKPAAAAPAKATAKKTPPKKAPAVRRTAKKTTGGAAENQGLVASVREELENADAVDTFAGQLALQLARRLVTPDETGISSLSKELRTVMAAALQGLTPPAATAETEDEVEKARRKREEARQAAGLT